jgi:hypothetical protein
MKDWNLKLQFKISQANLEKMAWQTYPQENPTLHVCLTATAGV